MLIFFIVWGILVYVGVTAVVYDYLNRNMHWSYMAAATSRRIMIIASLAWLIAVPLGTILALVIVLLTIWDISFGKEVEMGTRPPGCNRSCQ